MIKLKAVIISVRNVMAKVGTIDVNTLNEIGRFIRFIQSHNILPIIISNTVWSLKSPNVSLRSYFMDKFNLKHWYIAELHEIPWKPRKECIDYILRKFDLKPNEALYVGNTDYDMRTAVNGNILFLNAKWFSEEGDYGLFFNKPKELGRFIDTFCLREHLWFFEKDWGKTSFRAMAPYSTSREEFRDYSYSALYAAKNAVGDIDFWSKYLCSSIYFSGIHNKINYIAPYPRHEEGNNNTPIESQIIAFSKCFRISYLKDLLFRHTTAVKSSAARINRIPIDHLNQLNTIHIKRNPLKHGGPDRYSRFPLNSNKSVLIYDDICTNGYSLETAKVLLHNHISHLYLVSWLKTINSDYHRLSNRHSIDPFTPSGNHSITDFNCSRTSYHGNISDPWSPSELDTKLSHYHNWEYPC